MSKKNKNKHKQQNQIFQPKPNLTNEEKQEIEKKYEEHKSYESIEQLSSESENKLREAEAKEDLSMYWSYVKEINKRLEALLNKTNIEKDKYSKLNEELEASKKNIDLLKANFINKLEELNKKEKELTEREFALDNGEYTTVIRRLLDVIRDTEKKVFTDTENLLKELSEFHKKNLEEFSNHVHINADFEKQLTELKKEKQKLEVENRILKEEKNDFQNKFEIFTSMELTLKSREAELERLKNKIENLEYENTKLKEHFENFQNAFGSTDYNEILKQHNFLKQELENFKKELNERPDKYEFDSKQAQIEELHAKIKEYQSKINESELLELKQLLYNQDSYVIEINAYKNQIESAKIREASLKRTIDDLLVTIEQLKGESAKKSEAFEFAKKCDADKKDLGINHLKNKKEFPKDLSELSVYIQQWMAFKSDKPLYYKLETIRVFLAGLHMSPITILQGISGTGKTSLPREFAKALVSDEHYIGIDEDNQNKAPYRICAVQAGWRDNMDLMGYYNSFEHKYKETDFFKALYIANQPKYSDTLFLIILDEMNLSRPEHYFADFLSLLEQSQNERFIGFFSTPNDVLPALIKGGRLKIPENVRFIGTANHDESTLEFAPKTYDRSNLIEMPKNHPHENEIKKVEVSFNVTYSWLKKKFEEAETKHHELSKRFHKFINSESMLLLLEEKGIGIGNRFEYQAEKFISVYIDSGNNKEKDIAYAVDHLITSRLFRLLKNRYDLDKANLTKFKEEYVKLFQDSFKYKPDLGIELLNSEIDKK